MKEKSNLHIYRTQIIFIILIYVTSAQIFPKTFRIGISKEYLSPSMVSALVNDGDTLDIDAGLYKGDVCSWDKNNLFFRGIGGLAHLSADGKSAEQKAIWVIKGSNCKVENIEFSDCKVPDNNGAGIRAEGENLFVRHCYFHDNEDGLLSGANSNSTIDIEFSEFARNGNGDGFSHNMYIGKIGKFILRFCYIHNANIGHNVKSRAAENLIAYNLIIDSTYGNASYQIDLPNGGLSHIIGNSIMKGNQAQNPCFISYGMESIPDLYSKKLFIYNNTFVNEKSNGKALQFNDSEVAATVMNNLFVAMKYFCDRPCDTTANIFINNIDGCKFKDKDNFNYQLTESSPGIDMGVDMSQNIPKADYIPIEFEYKNPQDSASRNISNTIDIGAFEFEPTTGIAENIKELILDCEIFPNPVTPQSLVVIKTNSSKILLDVTDINGNQILGFGAYEIGDDAYKQIEFRLYDRFNLNKFSKGIYFLRIKSDDVVKTVKFVL